MPPTHCARRTAGEFFLPPVPLPPGHVIPATLVDGFLTPVPPGVRRSLHAVLPEPVAREIGVAEDAWVGELLRLLADAGTELAEDVAAFEARREQAAREQKYALADQCLKVLKTLRNRPLIDFLATRNILPKYGFPMDTVELRTDHARGNQDRVLELTRDLTLALNEYAPGAEVVAGGQRWKSGGVYRLPGRELVSRYYQVCDTCGFYWEAIDLLTPECPSCHTTQQSAARRYVEPAYGFVASDSERQGASQAPRRSWSGATYIVDSRADVTEGRTEFPGGGTSDWRSGARGQFVVLNEGPGRAGFLICQWCGWGTPAAQKRPREHKHLLKAATCTGPLSKVTLAHRYETDFVELRFPPFAMLAAEAGALRSTVYALLEGASTALEISRDDIDGTIHLSTDGVPALVLFDTTPGGAGNTPRIAEHLADVVQGAVARVTSCECGEETICYGCLRAFRNERYHEQLSRRAALALLSEVAPLGRPSIAE